MKINTCLTKLAGSVFEHTIIPSTSGDMARGQTSRSRENVGFTPKFAPRFAPFGAFGAMAHTVGKYGIGTLGTGRDSWV